MLTTIEAPPALSQHEGAQAQALCCHRCGPGRTLGILSPGRLWWRVRGQTILVTGGHVVVWCPVCQARHDVDLDAARLT